MADWDPFALDEQDQAANAQVKSAEGGDTLTTYISDSDLEAVTEQIWKDLEMAEPWKKAPAPQADLSWWTPTCSYENWTHKDVTVKLSEGFIVITFNQPENNNMLTDKIMIALCDAVALLHRRPDLRMAIFTGEGKMFSGGKDASADEMNNVVHGFPSKERMVWEALNDRARKGGAYLDGKDDRGKILHAKLWHTLSTVPQFTISLVNGSVMGYAFAPLACCDMVIALDHAYFNISDAKMGQFNPLFLPYLVGKVGISSAKCIMCTAENMNAEKAKQIGLVNEVVANVEEAHKKIVDLAEVLTACGPRSVEACKMLLCGVSGQQVTEGISFFTAAMLAMVTISQEAKDGMVALQARQPKPWEVKPIKPEF